MTTSRLHAVVKGDVQGVGFRAFVQRRASVLGLKGWVRNVSDGSVELIAEGETDVLRTFLSDLEVGPSLSHVENVDYRYQDPQGDFRSFTVRYD